MPTNRTRGKNISTIVEKPELIFESYCKSRWDFNRAYAYRLIGSAQVVDAVSPIGIQSPGNERQTRPLAKLEPDRQREAWQKAVETAPEGKVTAAHVSIVGAGKSY